MDQAVSTLLQHYSTADNDGREWYRESKRFARYLRRRYSVGLGKAAGIIAALSPRLRWEVNMRAAEALLATGDCTGVLGASKAKAQRIYEGARPLDVLSGPKTRAFYRAIMGDEDAAVIDIWMVRAMGLDKHPSSVVQYEKCATALRSAAEQVGLSTAQFQAVVWTKVRADGLRR